jgi:hypothetical protein
MSDHCPLPEAPYGTCVPCWHNSLLWWVRGTKGWHLVNASTGRCTCLGSQYRQDCAHCESLRRHLRIQAELQEISPHITARAKKEVREVAA